MAVVDWFEPETEGRDTNGGRVPGTTESVRCEGCPVGTVSSTDVGGLTRPVRGGRPPGLQVGTEGK